MTSRDDAMVRTAAIRAKVQSLIVTKGPQSLRQLRTDLKPLSEKIAYNTSNLGIMLAKAGFLKNSAGLIEAPLQIATERAPAVKRVKAVVTGPSVAVDVVKATGRVRLSIGGLVIEIGVI